MATRWIVFTDLDGTLLDHNTYSHAPAVPMLKALKAAGIPVIPNTSKTFSELQVLRKTLGLDGPFIIENGAAIHIPHGVLPQKPAETQWQGEQWVKQFTSRRLYWINLLKQAADEFEGQFTHFSAMGIDAICEATGLSPEEAALASDRQYGEPVMWLGDAQQKGRFITTMRLKGATPLQGGRFIHIAGDCNKGQALTWMMQEFRRQYPDDDCKSIALGDGENDLAMLEAADIAVLVRSPSHALPKLKRQDGVWITQSQGPQGWADTLASILTDLPKEA